MTAELASTRTLFAAVPPLIAAGVAAWLVVWLGRRRRESPAATYTDLRRPYSWTCVAFAAGILGLGLARTQANRTSSLSVALVFLFLLPWTVFALNFVGRGHLLTRRRVGLGVVVTGLLTALALANAAGVFPPSPDSLTAPSVIASVLALGELAVAFTAGGLVLLSTYRYRNVSVRCGLAVTLPMVLVVVGAQLARPSAPLLNDVVLGTVSLTVAGCLAVAATRYDVVRVRPGTGTAGERAAVREMDGAIVTVDRDGTIARTNRAAVELFGRPPDDATLADVLGHTAAALADEDTVDCWTEAGRKRLDPRVTELSNDYGEVFGYAVALIDVTDRELRRQRIEVLNRILRHNVRNSLDVIRANAELVDDEDRAGAILRTTDTLDRLSTDTREIERLVRRPESDRPRAALTAVVEDVTARVAEEHPRASVSRDVSGLSATVDAALCRFALRNVVENAVVHNDGDTPRVAVRAAETDAGVRLVVADDGPGIPEAERSVIEGGSESQRAHANSLGLWGTRWAVREMGGELSFRDSDLGGTAVVIEMPAS